MEQAKQLVANELDDETIDAMIQDLIDDPSVQIEFGEILTQLSARGESGEELAGFAKAMRSRMRHVDNMHESIDVCGTGGDHSNTFNISTAVSFVLAGAGARVTKHGNRAATSKSGSADVLEALGVDIGMAPDRDAFLNFLFAPEYHPAMKVIAPVRKRLGTATVFNMLGPILNPANVKYQMIGTPNARVANLMAHAASALDYTKVGIVYNSRSIDELTTDGENYAYEVSGEHISHHVISPDDYGLVSADINTLRGGSPAANADIIHSILGGEQGGRRDTIILNAGYALYISGVATSLRDGIERAQTSIDSGAAQGELAAMVGRSIKN